MQQLDISTNELAVGALRLADLGIGVIPLWWPVGNVCACPKGSASGLMVVLKYRRATECCTWEDVSMSLWRCGILLTRDSKTT